MKDRYHENKLARHLLDYVEERLVGTFLFKDRRKSLNESTNKGVTLDQEAVAFITVTDSDFNTKDVTLFKDYYAPVGDILVAALNAAAVGNTVVCRPMPKDEGKEKTRQAVARGSKIAIYCLSERDGAGTKITFKVLYGLK